MQRRRLFEVASVAGLATLTGCLTTVTDHLEGFNPPGAVEGTGTPSPEATLADHREAAEDLAYLTVTLEDCTPIPPGFAQLTQDTFGDEATLPTLDVGLATEAMSASDPTEVLSKCDTVAGDHPPYLDDPSAFIHETHFDYAYLLSLHASEVATLTVEYVGALPEQTGYVEVKTTPGDLDLTILVRVGAWVHPESITLGVTDSDDTTVIRSYGPADWRPTPDNTS